MKPDKAKELIKETFEQQFDKDRFTWFLKNLFPDKIEFRNKVYTGNYIKEAFRTYIRKYEQIGKFEDNEGNTIDLLAVELLRGQSVERARTSQRNFIAQYLKNKNHREGALVAFYSDDSADWRFSLIKMEYSLEKKKDELTPAKRFSFLVGKDEKSHTAQNQLTGLLTMQTVPVLQEIEGAFNIETVTKEFFEKYKQLFLDLNEHIEKEIKKSKQLREELENKSIDSVSFTKKLLGQIVFLYFLQKKGWLGVPKDENWGKGDKKFLRSLLEKAIAAKENFFSDSLVYLFYEALAKENRGGSDSSYYKKLDCRIPFLNGGLFEADYDWEKITVEIPNKFFTNRNITKEGDTGDGILDVFDRYNFTVKEDEPLEKEVAVDPEMLGKVFENLLEVKDRKSKGAFYTPREIVHYMCQESLIAYLDTSLNGEAASYLKLGTEQTDMFGNKARKGQLPLEAEHGNKIKIERSDIEIFIREGITFIEHDTAKEAGKLISKDYGLPESIRNHAKEIDKALAHIRICDPAIGSGAFPVGMMNEIVKARIILATYLPDTKKHSPYELKRHTIQECIYGVDIDHSAIDIAKLRLWLSLVVDEEDFYKIKPLPNLDYKIVRGNSLIGMPEGIFRDTKLEDEIRELEDELFDERDKEKKDKLRNKIEKKIRQLLDSAEQFSGYKIDFDFKVFFSKVFREKKGFDVVIGNPPYVRQELIKDIKPILQQSFQVYNSTSDLYTYFYELTYKLLNKNGISTFITSNNWIRAGYGKKLRAFFKDKTSMLCIVDFDDDQMFATAIVGTNILIFQKTIPHEKHFIKFYSKLPEVNPHHSNISQLKLDPESFSFGNAEVEIIKAKIKEQGKQLKDWKVEMNRGVTSGCNEAFYIDATQRKNLIKEEPKAKEFIKPILRGRDVSRYSVERNNQFLLFIPWHFPLHKDPMIEGASKVAEERFKKEYPATYNHLKSFKKELSSRNQAETGIRYEWYALQRCAATYYEDFEKEKLVWIVLSDRPKFAIDTEGSYTNDSTFIMVGENLKYLSAILNSTVSEWYFDKIAPSSGMGTNMWKKYKIELLPVVVPTDKQQKQIENLVDKILEIKKQDPKTNTSSREKQIDVMVYHLYNLTYDEAKIIDAELTEEEFEKYKL